jgi:hypothetical protein
MFEGALLDDLRAEALCGAPKCSRKGLIIGPGPIHQEPAPPMLPDQILRKRIGEHGARWRGVQDVRTAILLAQPVVAGTGIENQHMPVFQRIGDPDDRLRARVCDDERGAAFDMLFDLLDQFADIAALNDLESELLLEEPTGGVAVVDGEPSAGDAVIRRRHIKKRKRRRRVAQFAGEHDRNALDVARGGTIGRRLAWSGRCK